MSAILTRLKTYWTAFVAAVLGVLVIAVTYLTKRNRTLSRQRDEARQHADDAIDVIRHDQEVDIYEDTHLADVARGESDELTNPNDWGD
jgi:hypothetical protein